MKFPVGVQHLPGLMAIVRIIDIDRGLTILSQSFLVIFWGFTVKRLVTIAAAATAALMFVTGASAATVNTGSKGVTLTCTGICEVWDLGLTPDGFNPTEGDWLSGAYGGINNSNSNGNRLTFVNNVLGTSFSSQSESSDTSFGAPALAGFVGGENGGWTGSSEFYLAWGGRDPRYVLIRSGTENNVFTWTQSADASGLSGVDGFGEVSPVPLPASAVLLLAGLFGLTAVRRRQA